MLDHGQRGVAEIAQTVDALYAFAATADVVPDHLFDATHDALIADERHSGGDEGEEPGSHCRDRDAPQGCPGAWALDDAAQCSRRRTRWRRSGLAELPYEPGAAIEVKGWCPGVLRPMQSGDGLIVRVRPWCGAFGLEEARGLADAAERFGNGHIDLTRRANLQIRGIGEDRLPGLHAALERLDLIDRDASGRGDTQRHGRSIGRHRPDRIVRRPSDGPDACAAAGERTMRCAPCRRSSGFLVDGGGTVSIAAERADISLRTTGSAMAVGLDRRTGTEWLGSISPDAAARTALAAARAFLRVATGAGTPARSVRGKLCAAPIRLDADASSHRSRIVDRRRRDRSACSISAADAWPLVSPRRSVVSKRGSFATLLPSSAKAGAADIRLSPWRALYVEARDAAAARMIVEVRARARSHRRTG